MTKEQWNYNKCARFVLGYTYGGEIYRLNYGTSDQAIAEAEIMYEAHRRGDDSARPLYVEERASGERIWEWPLPKSKH